MAAERRWCARIQYPGLKPVIFGTLFWAAKAPMAEIEAEMHKIIRQHVPEGYKLVDLIPGQVFFVEEKDDGAA